MSFHFRVGARVVCIDIRPNRGGGLVPTYSDTAYPTEGGIYTIRDIFDAREYGHDQAGLLLVEVVNPPRWFTCRTGRRIRLEQFWLGFRFRPIHTTNIEVLTKLLQPEPAREPRELVDA